MLIVSANQTKVLLSLSPEEFSELIDRSRARRCRAVHAGSNDASQPVRLDSVIPRVSP